MGITQKWGVVLALLQTKCQLLQQEKLSPHLAFTHTDSLSFLSQGPPHASSLSSSTPLCSPAGCDTLAVPVPDISHLFKLFPIPKPKWGRPACLAKTSSKYIQTQPFSKIIKEDCHCSGQVCSQIIIPNVEHQCPKLTTCSPFLHFLSFGVVSPSVYISSMSWFDIGQMPGIHESHLLTQLLQLGRGEGEKKKKELTKVHELR